MGRGILKRRREAQAGRRKVALLACLERGLDLVERGAAELAGAAATAGAAEGAVRLRAVPRLSAPPLAIPEALAGRLRPIADRARMTLDEAAARLMNLGLSGESEGALATIASAGQARPARR